MKTLVRCSLLLLSVLVMSLPGLSVAAQGLTDDELELVQLVQHSYESLQTVQSYHAEGATNAFETISADFRGGYEAEASMDIQFSFDVVPNGTQTIDDMNGTIHLVFDFSQNVGGSQSLDVVLNSILLKGQNFSRIVESATDLGMPLNVWSPSPAGPPAPIPLDRETSEPFLLLYLVNPETVSAIEEQDAATINGESVRVILLDLDPAQLRAQRVIDELGIGPENATNFTASLSGVGALTLNTRYAMQVYIGEDGLPRGVEYLFANAVTGAQQNAKVDQRLTGVVSYSGFDAPITIQNPLEDTDSGNVVRAVGTELEDFVTGAYTNLQSLNSYRVKGKTVGTEVLSSDNFGMNLDMTLVYNYDVIPNGRAEIDNMNGTSDIVLNLVQGDQPQHMAVLLDNVLLDGTTYTLIQKADVAGGLGMPMGEWVESGPVNTEIIPDDRANSEPFMFYYLVDPLTIQSLTELPSQTFGGQQMRVFEVALDPAVLRSLGVITATGIGEGTSFNLTASFDGMGQLRTETSYVMMIFIGENDNLPYCIEYNFDQVVTTELKNGQAYQSIKGVLEYSNFDAKMTIGNPLESDVSAVSTSDEPLDFPQSCFTAQ